MTDEKNCEKCGKHDSCGKIFKLLDKNEDKKIAIKFMAAFFIPLLIFIFSLVILYSMILRSTHNEILSGIVSVITAVLLVLIYAFIYKINSKHKG